MFLWVARLAALTLCLVGLTFPAAAEWPERQIHIIVPLPAGSAADVVARLIAARLSESLGQSVVVDNRDGGSGAIGTGAIAHADPDGYTIGIATSTTLATAPALNPRIGYNSLADFAPVSLVGYSPYVLVTNPSVPAKSVAEFIALAKSRPGVLTYSSVGDASLAHLAGELFGKMAGVKLNQVPYKSSTQAVIDLLGGRIDSQFGILTTTHQYIREGKVNPLGVTTLQRVTGFPEIPTIAESGLPGFDASLWLAVVAPAKAPLAVVSRLNRDINRMLDDQEIRKLLFAQSIFVELKAPGELAALIAADYAKWKELAATAGL